MIHFGDAGPLGFCAVSYRLIVPRRVPAKVAFVHHFIGCRATLQACGVACVFAGFHLIGQIVAERAFLVAHFDIRIAQGNPILFKNLAEPEYNLQQIQRPALVLRVDPEMIVRVPSRFIYARDDFGQSHLAAKDFRSSVSATSATNPHTGSNKRQCSRKHC